MKKHSIFLVAVIMLLSVVLYGCGESQEVKESATEPAQNQEQVKTEPEAQKPITVKLGIAKYASNAPYYIADAKGFFEEEGINLEIEWFNSATAVNVAVASNNVDVGSSSFTADLYNMVAAGQKVAVIADKGREEKGYRLSAMIVHKDSDIQKVEDLKGKKIGVSTVGSSTHYMAARLLELHGLTTKDAEFVPLNGISGQMEALKGKNVDAVVLNSSNIERTINEGYGRVLVNVSDEMPYQSVGTIASPKFTQNKDAVVRFLKGYVKGARYFFDAALTQKDGQLVKGENYDEVISITSKVTEQPEEIVAKSLSFIDPNGKLLVDDFQTQVDWFTKEKLVSAPIDLNELLHPEYLEEALKTLK